MKAQIDICGRLISVSGDDTCRYYKHYANHPVFIDDISEVLKKVVGKDWVCMDAGANIGFISMMLGFLAEQGKVYSFEPNSNTHEHLSENLASFANAQAVRAALGAKPGQCPLVAVPGFSAGCYLAPSEAPEKAEELGHELVALTTVDAFITEHSIDRLDLLKIDVEGFELDVLNGARDTLAKLDPVVVLEFNADTISRAGSNPKHFLIEMFKHFEFVCILDRNSTDILQLRLDGAMLDNVVRVNRTEGFVDNLLCMKTFRPIEGLVAVDYYRGISQRYRRVCEHRDQVIREREYAIWLYKKAIGEA